MFSRLASSFLGSSSRTKSLVTAGALALSFAGIRVSFCSAQEDGSSDGYKEEFRTSYDDVASIVAERRQVEKIIQADPEKFKKEIAVTLLRRKVAKVLMHRLGYSQEELDIIGDDVDLMQGTGNPFPAADIQEGEAILDLGSGFGVDAILAAFKVGDGGRVFGIDISEKEVYAANVRAYQRNLNNIIFLPMDMEKLEFKSDVIDCVISNGGFCLVPDKRQAFAEVYRVLKPKGRMSIACTTLRSGYGNINRFFPSEGDPEPKKWPSCMEVFIPFDAIVPLLEDLGFEDIVVDDSNSKMSLWQEVEDDLADEVEAELAKYEGILPSSQTPGAQDKDASDAVVGAGDSPPDTPGGSCTRHNLDETPSEPSPKGVPHGHKDEAYKHMSSLSMNDICARVVISARVPSVKRACF